MRTKIPLATDVVTRENSDGEETEHIVVPISSTEQDRDGDEFSEKGVEDLRDQIKDTKRPVFGNHGRKDGGGMFSLRYDWKDIIGALDDAEIQSDGDTKILNGYIEPNPENDRAATLKRYVKSGMPVGFSIGFGVGKAEEKDAGGYVFHSTDLMEVSAVGIQSNRESVATNAADTAVAMAKAAGDLDGLDLDEPTLAKAMVDELLGAVDDVDDTKHSDPTAWVQKQFSGEGTAPPTESQMGTDTDDDEQSDILERIVDLQERQADVVEETNDHLEDLSERLAALEAKEDDDDDEDEDEDEEDDDKSGDDTGDKGVTLVAGDDADEDVVKRLEELREKADDGALELENLDESKTTLFGKSEEESDEKDAADDGITDNGGWI